MKRKKYFLGGPLDSIPATQVMLPFPSAPQLDYTGLGPVFNRPATTLQPTSTTKAYAPVDTSRSKSKDRFREHATGGFLESIGGLAGLINPALSLAGPAVGLISSLLAKKNTKVVSSSAGGYNTGGQMDTPLAPNSFQVKGNPSKTDGNYYPQFNSYLDHNEVVKNDFVFSDSIRSPLGGQKFSEAALKIENATKRATRKLKLDPTDPHAQNTIMHNEKQSAALAALQEAVATRMGLRNADGSTTQRHQSGGPIGPPYPWQDWATWTPTYDVRAQQNIWNAGNHAPTVTDNAPSLGSNYPSRTTQTPSYAAQLPATTPQPLQPTANVAPAPPRPTQARPGRRVTPAVATKSAIPDYLSYPAPLPGMDLPLSSLPPRDTYTGTTIPYSNGDQVQSVTDRNTRISQSLTQPGGALAPTTATAATPTTDMKQKFTAGDYMQLGSFAGEILPLLGGAEKVPTNLDSTQLTKEFYDVRQPLQQNQRNFSNVAASINTPSETLRRALLSQLDATKSNRDSQLITQYQGLNQHANTAYEDRLSNQRRYNVGQQNYASDLNARNRASYRYAVQNAFESLGNLGQAFNQRDYQKKQLNLLKGKYGDVYSSIISNLMGQ